MNDLRHVHNSWVIKSRFHLILSFSLFLLQVIRRPGTEGTGIPVSVKTVFGTEKS